MSFDLAGRKEQRMELWFLVPLREPLSIQPQLQHQPMKLTQLLTAPQNLMHPNPATASSSDAQRGSTHHSDVIQIHDESI